MGFSGDVAPRRFGDGTHIVCRVHADFSAIPLSRFPKSRSVKTEREYYEVDFKLEATILGGTITWRLLYQDTEYGSTTVSFDE